MDTPRTAPHLRLVIITLLSTLALLGLGLQGMKRLAAHKKPPKKHHVAKKARVVDIVIAHRGPFQTAIRGYASAAPARTVTLAALVRGQVVEAHQNLRVGGFIQSGELLFRIDTADLDLRAAQAQSDLDRAKARLTGLRVQRRGAKKTLREQRHALSLTQKQLARDERLAALGHLAEATADRTRLDLSGRHERLNASQASMDLIAPSEAQARAELKIAEKRLEQIELERSRARVVATFDLQVVEGGVEVGDWLNLGQRAAVVEDISNVELGVAVPADSLLWLIPPNAAPKSRRQWAAALAGRPATVTRDRRQDPPRIWQGTVHRVGAGLDARTRMIRLYVRVDAPLTSQPASPPLPLLPGMFCEVQIPGRVLSGVFTLPRKALQSDGRIYLLSPQNTLEPRAVELARRQGEQIVIQAGLNDGDRVILTALPNTTAGSPLVLKTDQPEPAHKEPTTP